MYKKDEQAGSYISVTAAEVQRDIGRYRSRKKIAMDNKREPFRSSTILYFALSAGLLYRQ